MATGDILSAIVNRDGRLLHLKIEGLASGGTYLLGASTSVTYTDRTGNAAKVKLNVTSAGYDTAGNLGAIARNVWGTIDELLSYGDANAKWIQSGSMSGQMRHGETVTQTTTGATATVITNCPCAPLIIKSVTGSPNSSDVWTGGTSGAVFTPGGSPAAYTGLNNKREGVQGSDLWIAISLSEYIYSDCTLTLDALSAIYTKTAVPSNAATAFAVTNSSNAAHAKSIVRWASVPYERITAATFTIKAGAYHRFAMNAKPLACMKFTATDGTTTRTVYATEMTRYQCPATGLFTGLYEATFTTADFADNTTVTCNCIAYPWVGNASSLTDSSANASPSTSLCDLPLFIDWDDDYGVTVCYVDQTSSIDTVSSTASLVADETLTQATSGATAIYNFAVAGSPNKVYVTNVTGTPNSSSVWTGGTSGATFTPSTVAVALGSDSNAAYDIANDATAQANPSATIGGAAVAIKAFNNANRSRNNADAGTIYLKRGNHKVSGATTATTANTWMTITRQAGLANSDARIIKKAALSPVKLGVKHLRLYDVDIQPLVADALTVWETLANAFCWTDSCRFTATSQVTDSTWGTVHGYAFVWQTHNTVTKQRVPGDETKTVLSLGNNNTTQWGMVSDACMIGCTFNSASTIISDTSLDNVYYASNKCAKTSNKFLTREGTCSIGMAIICNECESISGGGPEMKLFADSNVVSANNVCIAHNTTAGDRINWGYNDTATAADRTNFSAKYNALQWFPHKYDPFSLAQTSVLCYPVTHGVGHAGNNSELSSDPYPPRWGGWLTTRQTSASYRNDLSKITTSAGNGDYEPRLTSVLVSNVLPGEAVFPWDIRGNEIANDGTGSAGARQPERRFRNLMLLGAG